MFSPTCSEYLVPYCLRDAIGRFQCCLICCMINELLRYGGETLTTLQWMAVRTRNWTGTVPLKWSDIRTITQPGMTLVGDAFLSGEWPNDNSTFAFHRSQLLGHNRFFSVFVMNTSGEFEVGGLHHVGWYFVSVFGSAWMSAVDTRLLNNLWHIDNPRGVEGSLFDFV